MNSIVEILLGIRGVVDVAIPVALGCAVLFFIWGLAVYILRSGDVQAKEEGRNRMLWGTIALFVIVSIWGIVGFIGTLLNIGQGGTGGVPGITNPLR